MTDKWVLCMRSSFFNKFPIQRGYQNIKRLRYIILISFYRLARNWFDQTLNRRPIFKARETLNRNKDILGGLCLILGENNISVSIPVGRILLAHFFSHTKDVKLSMHISFLDSSYVIDKVPVRNRINGNVVM